MYAPLSLHRPELVKAIISLQTCNHNCVLPVVVVAVWEYYTFETKSAFQCNCLILNQMLAVFEAITENIGIAFSSHSITSIGMGCGGGDCDHQHILNYPDWQLELAILGNWKWMITNTMRIFILIRLNSSS